MQQQVSKMENPSQKRLTETSIFWLKVFQCILALILLSIQRQQSVVLYSQPYCCLTGLTTGWVLLRYRGTMPGRAPSRSIPKYWCARECCQVIIK
ncbi:hypothetical protein VN97_g11797 [Penicillium thymicola]|uniref:Uncharacterized protein n=1 Tax=Penicillium thymicola TaxID=293382 RepID=A0AAI9T7H8_PENTH|nr:hypothetical protein VN97_g11797 [Penicillium thymicola]